MNADDETLLTAYIDGELDPVARAGVESAVRANPELAEQVRQLTAVHDVVASLLRPELPADLSQAVVARIAQRRAALGQRRYRLLPRPQALAGIAAAAVILVAAILGVRFARTGGAPHKRVRPVAIAGNHGVRQHRPTPAILASNRASSARPQGAQTRPPKSSGPAVSTFQVASRDDKAVLSDREQRNLRQLLDSPKLKRVFIVTDVIGGHARQQVDSLVQKTPRIDAAYARITVSQGIVIDPNHPDQATVFALVMDDRELKEFKAKLAGEFPQTEEQTAPDPRVVTQLADIGQVAVLPGTPATELIAAADEPARVVALKAAKAEKKDKVELRAGDDEEFPGMPVKVVEGSAQAGANLEEARPTPEQMRSGPYPAAPDGPGSSSATELAKHDAGAGAANATAPDRLRRDSSPRPDASIVLVWVTSRGNGPPNVR